MAVKHPAGSGSAGPRQGPPADPAIHPELIELLRVMPRVLRALRRGGDDTPPRSAQIKQLFKDGALGPRHVPVLVVLVLEGPMTVGDLAHRLGLNLATVSLMAGELARVGLVDRREDERDRRRTLVSIPHRHCRRLAPLVDQRIEPLRRALERMSPDVRKAFLAGWRVLAEETERAAGRSPQEGC